MDCQASSASHNTNANDPGVSAHSDGDYPVPGKLRGSATLTLQTQQAARLVRGRAKTSDKPAIIGLLSFAAMCRTIGHGVQADDPYADWWRLRVDSALRDARALLDDERWYLDTLFSRQGAVAIRPARSEKPVRIGLNFTNPDAFRAAQVIGHFDGVACRLLSLSHTGTLDHDDARGRLERCGRVVRRVLQSAVGYRYLGIDRAAVRQGTAEATQARELMGECPPALLDKAFTHPVHRPPQPGDLVTVTSDEEIGLPGLNAFDDEATSPGSPGKLTQDGSGNAS